jgi:hypothetical protein
MRLVGSRVVDTVIVEDKACVKSRNIRESKVEGIGNTS